MNRRAIFFSGMAIVTVSIFFASGHMVGNEKVFAFGGIGHGFGHGFLGHGFGHFYGPGFGYYGPGYVVDNLSYSKSRGEPNETSGDKWSSGRD